MRKLRAFIIVPLIISALLLLSGYIFTINYVRKILIDERKRQSNEMIQSIHTLFSKYRMKVDNGEMEEAEAREYIKFTVKSLKYGEDYKDYYWILDSLGNIVAHPYIDDTLVLIKSNPEARKTLKELAWFAKSEGEGFISYNWQWKNDTSRIEAKISYVEYLEFWNWVVGTGFYTHEVDKKIAGLTRFVSMIIAIIALIILFMFVFVVHRAFRNIARIREKESELHQSEIRFKAMADNLNTGLLIQEDGRTIYANKKLESILEMPEDKLLEAPIDDLVSAEEKARYKSYKESNRNHKNNEGIDLWIQLPSGVRKFIQKRASYEIKNKRVYSYILVSDITEQKKQQINLASYFNTLNQSPDCIIITDLEGHITFVNEAFNKASGYSSSEVIGQNPRILKSDKLPPSLYTNLWKTITQGETWKNEIINKKKNGELYSVSSIIFPVKNEQGEIIRYAAIQRDQTEQKQLEKMLREAKIQAELGTSIKNAFIQNVSHEVNTPLNAIYGFTNLLQLRTDMNDDSYSLLASVIRNTETLIRLFEDILLYSSIEAGDIQISKEEIFLKPMLQKMASRYNVKIVSELKKPVEIAIEISDEVSGAILLSDGKWIAELLDQLISNAIKYTPEGLVTIGYSIDYEKLIFFVEDEGVGIPVAEQKSVFDMFTHGSKEFVSLHEGTGIGLNIANKLARSLGGKLWFESIEDKGSIFYFSLSSLDVKNYKTGDKLISEFPYRELFLGKKCIVSEDNDEHFSLIKSLIKDDVDELIRVNDGNELITILENDYTGWHFILIDAFPYNQLKNVLKSLKSTYKNILLIAMINSPEEAEKIELDHFDGVLVKPFSKYDLYITLYEHF